MALASASGAERRPAVDPKLWQDLAAEIPLEQLHWRAEGKPFEREENRKTVWFSCYVPYVDAAQVRARLDATVPGRWTLSLRQLPSLGADDGGVVENSARCSFVARLTICGVTREDVGSGRDYKSAASDAFKRAAARFGVGAHLRDLPRVYVPVEVVKDGQKYRAKKPLQKPVARLRELLEEQERETRNAHRQTRRSA